MKMPMSKNVAWIFGWLLLPVMAYAQEVVVPPPENWKPAGEVTPPGPTASAESKPIVPVPMIQFGEFQLTLHGRIQVMAGLVGQDSHIKNGDVLNRDGFRVRRARLGVDGQFVDHWQYKLELDLLDEDSGGNVLLDANITYRPAEFVWVRAGAGKLPFGRAAIASSGTMQFMERPVWVNVERQSQTNMLDLNRQVGITVGGELSVFSYSVGAYNGSPGFSAGDINDGLLYLARLQVGQGDVLSEEADFTRDGFRWAFGINGYLNQAEAAEIRGAGADLSLKFAGFSFYAEALWAKSIPATRPESTEPTLDEFERWGMYAQAGYLYPFDFAAFELAVRFAMMDDNVHMKNEGDLWELSIGLNAYVIGQNVKLMLNYVMKEEMEGVDLSNDAVLAMMQLMF